MKKVIALLLAFVMLMALCACGSGNVSPSNFDEPKTLTNEQKIEQAKNLKELHDYYHGVPYNLRTEEMTSIAFSKWEEYVCTNLSGFYHNMEPMTNLLQFYLDKGYSYKLEDNRAVYFKSMQEVYFMPYSEQELTSMGLTLQDIPNMENSAMFKYEVIENEEKDLFVLDLRSLYVDETAYKPYKTLHLWWDVEEDCMVVYGFFPDETTEEGQYTEDNQVVFSSRSYYLSSEEALLAKQETEGDVAEYNHQKETLKKSKPQIGMTASEVQQCSWGYPNKINKDTYSWGVKEQWVYDDHGYVYLENGIVTSVSER